MRFSPNIGMTLVMAKKSQKEKKIQYWIKIWFSSNLHYNTDVLVIYIAAANIVNPINIKHQ